MRVIMNIEIDANKANSQSARYFLRGKKNFFLSILRYDYRDGSFWMNVRILGAQAAARDHRG